MANMELKTPERQAGGGGGGGRVIIFLVEYFQQRLCRAQVWS